MISSDAGGDKYQMADFRSNNVSQEKGGGGTTLKTTQKIKLPVSLSQVPNKILNYFLQVIQN